ncbi:metalloprotease [Halorarum halophilum]|uniref:Metalloprotease n=1 Tax=Halorarum halophilum TaxID=2743090 RepID=A0A7D5KLQ9_9EURY|nr:metalloprotease [Halobaculum halophilum]QLG27042.1 metalloprotease [Halobaculum halophilum]
MSRLSFSPTEGRDLLFAWLALGVAFALFFEGGGQSVVDDLSSGNVGPLVTAFVVSLVTAGVGFLLHELAHKVVAVRFGQQAAFRADYGMLFLAVVSAMAGFLFAAPGAVHHRGRITPREHGLIALAGPAVNVVLGALFLPVLIVSTGMGLPTLSRVGSYGVAVNFFLAAFNLIPFGPLDGATVRKWSTPIWLVCFLVSAALAVFLGLGAL